MNMHIRSGTSFLTTKTLQLHPNLFQKNLLTQRAGANSGALFFSLMGAAIIHASPAFVYSSERWKVSSGRCFPHQSCVLLFCYMSQSSPACCLTRPAHMVCAEKGYAHSASLCPPLCAVCFARTLGRTDRVSFSDENVCLTSLTFTGKPLEKRNAQTRRQS